GDGTGSCSGCHGNAKNPAPPFDLSGHTTPDALGVGAHQAHLTNSQRLTAPIACSSCHVVPAAIESPGHLDTSLPAEVTFSGLAVADSARPAWDRTTATCASSYCHGGGQSLAADTNFKLRKPVWTLGVSQAFCGSCHGAPPSTPAHRDVNPFDFRKCSDCHPNTIARDGSIIVSGPPGAQTSRHINGRIDVGP
ncbi:MAG: CxxxxCH/CxxCH domain c-type cytochrome, partial [Myxococcales bacterium]